MAISEQSLPKQILEFFSGLFSTEYWPARWNCGRWTDFHGWLYIVSDLMIWAAYFAIPLLLFRLVTKRTDLPFPRIFWLFISFILLCGMTHLMDAVIFWWPAYRLSAIVRFVAGIVSLFTVYALYRILPLVFTLRTAKQLEAEIEQRKKAEEEARLQLLEHEKTKELLKVKDDFINLASHELKTPLTSLKGYLHIVQMKSLDGDAQTKELVTKATNQATKLTHLINDLFNVSKMQMGLHHLNKSRFNLTNLIYDCRDNFEAQGKELSVQAEFDVWLDGDIDRIKQVLDNLIDNAFKYSPAKSVVILECKQIRDRVRVSVRDFGLGIAEDKLPYLFERYYRVEHTSQNYSGMGLGLYISSQVINLHGGIIGVESKLGSGSTFWFEMPASNPPKSL